MNPPSKVTIGAHTYEIRTDAETARLLRDDEVYGDSRPTHLLVRVDVDRPHTATAETTLHELLHCCWSQTPLKEDDEEATVTALAPLVLHMLRANPALVEFLTAV